MVPKIGKSGKSFKSLATYLTHDADKAKTANRVDWTHTLNLAHDHIPSAVDEMLWTARAAELLKEEAGVHAGGRPTENPVKQLSMNWALGENPTREHMIETAEDFLQHMGWHEHQAILVAHNDQPRKHLHMMINAIHPETGLRLNESFEYRRASEWALNYELEHGKIHCENRIVENFADREKSPTREMWLAFREAEREFARDENGQRSAAANDNPADDPKHRKAAEWKFLNSLQREERESWFLDGRAAFKEARRQAFTDIREEFRERWADYHAALREGGNSDELEAFKQNLLGEQRVALASRRDQVCADLKETRDIAYRELRAEQRDAREGLKARQAAGHDSSLFLGLLEDRFLQPRESTHVFQMAASETTGREPAPAEKDSEVRHARQERTGMRSGFDVGANVASGAASAIGSIAGSLGDAFAGGRPAPRAKPRPDPANDIFEYAAKEARIAEDNERKEEERRWYEKNWAQSRD